ncbi:MAG: NAD(P)-dependent oxidoreductase [Elusimicrobia bacterium]|nr:NAD(P)-dependent oxidoreductase [Elusimicrobiota bacterium]
MDPNKVAKNFSEIYPPMAPEEAAVEANRCLYCYDAPCIQACPTRINIPKFIKQIATKNALGSAKTILEANPMGHSCARVCPVDSLCEGACVYHAWHKKPIQIARLQRVATDYYYSGRTPLFYSATSNGKKVAMIGAGPASLSCAFYLAQLGYSITLFEKNPKPGGLNMYGIAEYKMTQETALKEVDLIRDLGVEIKTGVEVGKDYPVSRLDRDFDAVFVGVGLGSTASLGITGENLKGVLDALTFIRHIKTRQFSKISPGRVTVVIGAGNTAIDAVTQAKRSGTPRVLLAYRRSEKEMPAYEYEYEIAKQDGIEFLWNALPFRILGKTGVTGIEFLKTKTDSRGHLKTVLSSLPRRQAGKFRVSCDRVIVAIGQTKQIDLFEALKLELDASGRIRVDSETLQTNRPKFFAGGDAINGGREVVNAAADGKRAAAAIHRYLTPEKESRVKSSELRVSV